MEISIEQYDNIQKYLDGIMDTKSSEKFLDEIEKNPELRAHLELETSLRTNPFLLEKTQHASEIRNKILEAREEWKNEQSQKTPPVLRNQRRNLFYIATAAASVALIVIFIATSVNNSNKLHDVVSIVDSTENSDRSIKTKDSTSTKLSFSSLFSRFYKKEKALDKKPVLIAKLLNEYDKNQYAKLQKLNIEEDLPTSKGVGNEVSIIETIHYYKALSYIETKNYTLAVKHLMWVIDTSKSMKVVDNAKWYRALLFVEEGNKNKAIDILKTLTKDKNSENYIRATELLKNLQLL